MAKLTKRAKFIREQIEPHKVYGIEEAIKALKACAKVKFNESVDVSINLGIDSRKSDQAIRGAVVLPHGTGRSVRVAVFAQGEHADAATAAGADIVGFEELAEEIKKGKMDFEVVIATPDAMRVVGKLGQILGPRGLMPNPKVGTVTADISTAVKNAKSGQVQFRTDKAGIVHAAIGKLKFDDKALKENLRAFLDAVMKAKPATAKGSYVKKISLSSTMGPGLVVDQASIVA